MANPISQKFCAVSLLKFTLPSIIMMLSMAIFYMFGSIFASKYIGENALSAINIVFPIVSTVLAVAIMFATGANAIIAANLGRGDYNKARENFTIIFIIGTIVGLVFTLLSIVFKTPLVQMLGAFDALQILCEEYLVVYALWFPFAFWQVYAQYFFVTIGKPVFGMVIVIIGGVLNIPLCYYSMAVWNWGIIGASFGAGIMYAIPAIVFVIYFFTHKENELYFVKPKRHKGFLLDTCTNGSSEMVTNLAIAIVTFVLNLIMIKLAGENGVAAVSVIVQVQFLLSSLYIGFGGGVAPIFAYANGKEDHVQIKKVFKLSAYFMIISSIILVAICLIFADSIVGLFIQADSTAYALTKTGFIIFAIGYLFAGINICASVFFTSMSNGKISATISFLRTFVFIIGMLIVLPEILGTTGVWIAIPTAEILTLFIVFWLLKKYKNIYHY